MRPMHGANRLQPSVSGASVLLLAASVGLGGCAGSALFSGTGATRTLFADRTLSAQQAGEQLVPGVTTQSDVLALLGQATVIRFDSGQSVWVYRMKPAGAAVPGAEFVILFAPSGLVQKTRTRTASGQAEAR